MQHLKKSTNLLCIGARQALREKMWPIQGRWHDLPKAKDEDSEDGNLDLEEEGGLVDLDLMPVEVEVEGLIVEEEMVENQEDDVCDAEELEYSHRTGMAPGEISIESHKHLEAPPVYVKKFGGQAGKPIHANINGGYSNYAEQLETGSRENIWALFGGLYPPPVIPAGIRSFLRNPAESGGIKFGRQFCQICHSGDNKFRRNLAIPELRPELSPELTGTESGGMQ